MDTTTLRAALACGPIDWVSDAPDAVVIACDTLTPVQRACGEAIIRDRAAEPIAAACRWECGRRILATYSETDQTNSIRRALVLQRRLSTGAITDAELAEADALEQASNWIDAMTRHWQTIAAAGVSPFSDAAGWPNPPTP